MNGEQTERTVRPLDFLEGLLNKRVIVTTRHGIYTGILSSYDQNLNLTVNDVSLLDDAGSMVRTHKQLLLYSGFIHVVREA
ncbi:MAG TPA: LSM domain-containing protein [Methylococcales bacterium]|jgi:small nuclear ribonucleoprotein (snRNP)-like protein